MCYTAIGCVLKVMINIRVTNKNFPKLFKHFSHYVRIQLCCNCVAQQQKTNQYYDRSKQNTYFPSFLCVKCLLLVVGKKIFVSSGAMIIVSVFHML